MKIFLYIIIGILFVILMLSRLTGAGLRMSDGSYLGYSVVGNEWLFLEYQNIPVRMDGPYVMNDGKNLMALTVKGDGKTSSKLIEKKVTNEIKVIVDNDVNTSFIVPLRTHYPRSKLTILQPEHLFVVSDLEGEFDVFVNILQANNVIDSSLNWKYGSGHLVLVGDMIDRGINVVPILWLIYKLEKEAQIAGGNLHYVLGNHERYVLDGRLKSTAKKYHGSIRTTGLSASQLWSEKTELGRWLRSKPALLKVGTTLFVHAGISEKVLKTNPTLESVDAEVAEGFTINNSIYRNISNSVLHDKLGILFYRGLAEDSSDNKLGKKADEKHIDAILKTFNVDRITIGHTLVRHVSQDYNGKVIRVDVNHAGGISEALIIENDFLWRADVEGQKYPLEQVQNN